MARTAGSTARIQRLIALGAMALLAAATAAAFGRVFTGPGVTLRLFVAGLLSVASAVALERRSLVLATAISAVLMVMVTAILVFPGTTWFGLPTLETFSRIAQSAREVGEQARVQVAPTAPLQPLLLAAVTAVWAAVFSAHALAFRAGSPLLALLPPVALVAFADTVLEGVVKPLYGVFFLMAGIAVVFADGLRRIQGWGPVWGSRSSEARLYRDAGRSARRVTATAVVLAAFSPILVPGFGTSRLIDLSSLNEDDRIALSPLVSISNELKRSEPIEVFRVTSPRPTYHRMMSLTEFNGSTFLPPSEEAATPIGAEDTILPANVFEGAPLEESYRISHGTRYPWLAIPYAPAAVDVDRDLKLDRASTTVWLDSFLDEGDTYTTSSIAVAPTPEQLDQVIFPSAARFEEPAVRLPPDFALDEINELAARWTEGTPNTYRAILAIQDHLRDPTRFRYSKEVPSRGDSFTINDFLMDSRVGFCQQFASAMVVLLRTQGIPARVAVGFTQGTPVAGVENTYRVTTDHYHAWVEVRFPIYGWLAFEPTPTRENPVAASYLAPSEPCVGPDCDGPGGPGPGSAEQPQAVPTGRREQVTLADQRLRNSLSLENQPEPSSPLSARAVLSMLTALLLVVVLATPPLRAWRRRRRLGRAGPEPRALILASYELFTDRARDLGWGRSPAETPEEYRRKIRSSGLLSNGDVDRMTALAVAAAYSDADPRADDVTTMKEAAASTLQDLRRGTPAVTRVTGLYRRVD